MSERYSLIGHQAALLLGICLLTVWEMSVPVDAYRGEYMQTAHCLYNIQVTLKAGLYQGRIFGVDGGDVSPPLSSGH